MVKGRNMLTMSSLCCRKQSFCDIVLTKKLFSILNVWQITMNNIIKL